MRKLIELDAALEGLENLNAISFYEANEHSKEAYTEVKDMLMALPTVDAVSIQQEAIRRIEKKVVEVYGYPKTEYAEGYVNACKAAIKMLKSLSSVDTVQVRHGHWVRWYEEVYDSFGVGYTPHYKCSECDTEYDQYDAMRMNYCPHCGVKLDWNGNDNG